MTQVYESQDNLSVTTTNKLVLGRTCVYFCECCGHLQTNELENLRHYYAEEYEINLKSKEDDQLYAVVNDQIVYRSVHQANTLVEKVKFWEGCRVLDYGCAKSQTMKHVLSRNVDINLFLFDVTDKYIPYWQEFQKTVEWSTHTHNPAWEGSMDVVVSFYALEHVADLHEAINNIKKLLKAGGIFYFLVPNVYENAADFIVADHVQHFSRSSLKTLLLRNGFRDIDIDTTSHKSAFVVCATLANEIDGDKFSMGDLEVSEISDSKTSVMKMSQYWEDVVGRIQAFEASIEEANIAIYGAGFYGNFIATAMKYPERICCFVDQNPHLHNVNIRNRPVLAPENIPNEVQHVIVGMNPQHAKDNITKIESLKTRNLNYFFL
jgi:2-polyprenyl-3-methyl-5-hydroxy-6-metoxy-1,4-benzoquinol methylase